MARVYKYKIQRKLFTQRGEQNTKIDAKGPFPKQVNLGQKVQKSKQMVYLDDACNGRIYSHKARARRKLIQSNPRILREIYPNIGK